MDKVVERWVTTSKPLESRGLWKRFVQERNQILPQAKPSKSISDKYQDYLKAESYLEPKSQMFVRDEMGFDEGGRIGFARGSGDTRAVRPERQAVSKYDIKELNKAVKFYTDGKYKTWDEITKVAGKSTQADMVNAPNKVKEAYHTRIGIRNNLKNNKGKFVVPDPTGGQFKPVYFTEYSDKAFLKDLRNKKGPYEIATDYYLKNKKMIKKQMVGNVEYTRPIAYLAKVLTQRKKRDLEIAKEIKKFRAWSDKQRGPTTQREYANRVEKLLPRAIEEGIVPPGIDTNSKYFKWAKKQKVNPLSKLFKHMEQIGVEHIAGISRAVDMMDYKSLGEIVPLLDGKDVNFEKGLLYDRPMTGLAKNILKSDNATIQRRNLKALNNMSKEAAEMYNTIAVKYRLSPTDKNPIGGKMLERITKGAPIEDTLLRDADLLMKQYVASGGQTRKSFKHLDPKVQQTIKLYEAGNVKGAKKQLAQGLNKILDCKLAAGVNCDDPMSYYKSLKEQEKIAATGKGANKLKAVSKVRAAKNLLYGTIGPAALAVEGAIAGPLALYEASQGALPSEMLHTATYGIAGKDRDEIIQEASSEEIFKPRGFMETGEKLESLYSDPITGGYRGKYDRIGAIEDTEKKFRDQYYDSYFAHPKTGDFSESIFNLRLKEQQDEEAKYQKQKAQRKQEFADKYTNVSSGLELPEFAGGGIAGVRRPHAIPPKSGPMPQGGGLSSMFNRVRKW
jgi:hypothetical protein